MTTLARLHDADEALTAGLARVLAAVLRPGDAVLLDGPVGAGKTHFARALIRARQGEAAEDVPSPTFTIVQTYQDAVGEIWHADLYRLTDPSELAELGLDEALPSAVTLIEWPDRMGAPPPGALTVSLRETSPDRRAIELCGEPARWPGIARAAATAAFLHGIGWAEARLDPLAGDASARRYFRLRGPSGRAVLMDDPPPGSVARYLAMTEWLRSRGFHAPEVLARDEAHGLLLLEDLGDDLLARVLEDDPGRVPGLYGAVTDLLAELSTHAPPDFVAALDGAELAAQVELFNDWYAPVAGEPGAGAGVPRTIAELWDRLCADAAPVTGLRDFHAENIVLMADGTLGLLDFQDAVAVHPAYDLVSALQDARRDVAPEVEATCIARFVAATGADPARFGAAYALLGAQRGLRIMGIFTRLCVRDGKPRYLDFMPRVWAAIRRDVAHPDLAPLAAALDGIAAPDPRVIERIRARCASPTP